MVHLNAHNAYVRHIYAKPTVTSRVRCVAKATQNNGAQPTEPPLSVLWLAQGHRWHYTTAQHYDVQQTQSGRVPVPLQASACHAPTVSASVQPLCVSARKCTSKGRPAAKILAACTNYPCSTSQQRPWPCGQAAGYGGHGHGRAPYRHLGCALSWLWLQFARG